MFGDTAKATQPGTGTHGVKSAKTESEQIKDILTRNRLKGGRR